MLLPPFPSSWILSRDGDPLAFALYSRHYSFRRYTDGRRQIPGNRHKRLFVGPGEKMVLITRFFDALFVWRKFIDKSGQEGINCAVFRNESDQLSSDLILDAEHWAALRWPGQRLYTYVNSRKIQSTNPGYCFKQAGWQVIGRTKKLKLHILSKDSFPSTSNQQLATINQT